MKLYVIIQDEVFDLENFSHEPIIKLTKKEAQKEMRELGRQAKSEFKDSFHHPVYESSDMCVELYEDGRYCESHYSVAIFVVDVPNLKKAA